MQRGIIDSLLTTSIKQVYLQYSTARRTNEWTYRHVDISRSSLPAVETFLVVRQRTQLSKKFQMLFILFFRVLLRGSHHGSATPSAFAYFRCIMVYSNSFWYVVLGEYSVQILKYISLRGVDNASFALGVGP
jgi:hypothetical protein